MQIFVIEFSEFDVTSIRATQGDRLEGSMGAIGGAIEFGELDDNRRSPPGKLSTPYPQPLGLAMRKSLVLAMALVTSVTSQAHAQQTLDLTLHDQWESEPRSGEFQMRSRREAWPTDQTAIIVCDCWDYHHCLNAVRRLEQFAPRLNEVLIEARRRGVTIIHAPSDCMDAYQEHSARKRATTIPKADFVPHDINSWCSVIPAEQRSVYPIDQSDGGEDDDPKEHGQWREKLESLGRNPNMPWKRQTDMIEIDADADFISDRGDEVWNILQHRGIHHVILTGVHTNMCVLGRPFGLRQMARAGKHVVLMSDMTDTMYNPKSWPYVNHLEGTRRVISHIQRYVCPTVTSDQIIGGSPFRFEGDDRQDVVATDLRISDPAKNWTAVSLPHRSDADGARWYRAVAMIPEPWLNDVVRLKLKGTEHAEVWCNGHALDVIEKAGGKATACELPSSAVQPGDWNLIVIKFPAGGLSAPPVLTAGANKLPLRGRWQFRLGKADYSNMPLPAKFGGSADVAYAPEEPLWSPRPLTRIGEFTTGIEGPACDAKGNIFAVNFQRQGTIGRVSEDGCGEIFVQLPGDSIGNGIRFDRDGFFFVADYTQHNILKVDPKTRAITVHAHDDRMNQPNDLAIAPDGTLYASDPNWREGTGQLWRIDRDGKTKRLAQEMGTTNGIEVSPDGKTLYVNESKQRNVWAFTINDDRTLTDKRLVRQFDDHGFDGMRCDIDGNLYITRYGKGTVVKLSPSGEILREVPVLGDKPSNLCFGGPDGCTVYVTEVQSRRLVSFRVDRPGRSRAE